MSYPKAYFAAQQSSLEEFLEVYAGPDAERDLHRWSTADGATLLHRALRNPDVEARVAIADRLLDDGADAGATVDGGANALHVLLSGTRHDFAREARLLERLLDGGADVNSDSGRPWGRPVETLARTLKFSDATLAPFYDVLFSRPDLDVVSVGSSGRSIAEGAVKLGERRADLAARVSAFLAAA